MCPRTCFSRMNCSLVNQSIPSLIIPRATPRDLHILVVPGVGVSLLCLARGSAPGGFLNQNNNFGKSAIFALSLKQRSRSSFHMLYMLEVSIKQNLGLDSQVQIQIQIHIHIHIHLTSFFLGQSPDWQLRLIQ